MRTRSKSTNHAGEAGHAKKNSHDLYNGRQRGTKKPKGGHDAQQGGGKNATSHAEEENRQVRPVAARSVDCAHAAMLARPVNPSHGIQGAGAEPHSLHVHASSTCRQHMRRGAYAEATAFFFFWFLLCFLAYLALRTKRGSI